jgi:hypothetical protein
VDGQATQELENLFLVSLPQQVVTEWRADQGARKKKKRKQAEGKNFVFSQKTEGGPSRFLRKQREAHRELSAICPGYCDLSGGT